MGVINGEGVGSQSVRARHTYRYESVYTINESTTGADASVEMPKLYVM